MIYLEETFKLSPASPESLDNFVEFTQERFVPLCPRLGARLVAGWYSHVELFAQVTQVLEFDDMGALKSFRTKTSQERAWGEYTSRLEEIAPERRSRLLEPLESVPPDILHQAIKESQQKPLGAYFLAVLEVAADNMATFMAGLKQGIKNYPIIASWRPIAFKRNQVIDVWKGPIPQAAYQPANDQSRQFFRNLRPIAPHEYLIPVYTLPYSPLR
ncbi:MAG: NIPSNAP family protein [Dehalococcoidia bacterium]|nr:NIPSNAP family protein [Dehalococcoidia bacterium]